NDEVLLNDSFIIHYKNCTTWINGIEYSDKELVEHDHFTFVLPPVIKIVKNQTIKALSLEKLHLEALSTAGKIIEIDNITHYKFTAIYSTILLILILIIILRLCHKPRTIFLPHPPTVTTFVEPTIPSLWPSLHSREGGVTAHIVADTPPPPKPQRSNRMVI
ncbi:hypothetical protein KR059_002236, partial [Drosophila kikkawai]